MKKLSLIVLIVMTLISTVGIIEAQDAPQQYTVQAPDGATFPISNIDGSGTELGFWDNGTVVTTIGDIVTDPNSVEYRQVTAPDPGYVLAEHLIPIEADPQQQGETYEYTSAEDCFTLEVEMSLIGFACTLAFKAPATVETPPQSVTVIAGGNMTFASGLKVTSDGTIGNIVVQVCPFAEPCVLQIDKYNAGNVLYTTIFNGHEPVETTVGNAIENMLENGSSCGDAACNTVKLYVYEGETQVSTASFSGVPVDLPDLPSPMGTLENTLPVTTASSNLPSDSKVIKDGDEVIGHAFTLTASSEVATVSVPEGGTTVLYCEAACEVRSIEFAADTIVVLLGNDPDSQTPSDLNWDASVESEGSVKVYFLLYANYTTEQVDALELVFAPSAIYTVDYDGVVEKQ